MTKETLSYGSRTDVGLVREHNEDSLVARPPLFAVADGMGGQEAGEIASEIAIETLVSQAPELPDSKELGNAVVAANHAVMSAAANGIGRPGMGTTLTAAILRGNELAIAQVGDSRAYLLHDGVLQQLTRDHSYVANLVEQGEITEEEARWHPQRSVITRALGGDEDMVPDLYELDVERGDRLLLCSDGLYGMVEDERMKEILLEQSDPQQATDALVDEAKKEGGHDNITAIVVDMLRDTPEAARASAKKTRRYFISILCAFIFVIALAVGGIYTYARNNAFLVDQDNHVTVYRGIINTSLTWYERTTDVTVSDLPQATQDRLKDGVVCGSIEKANETVASYQSSVKAATAPESSPSSIPALSPAIETSPQS
jgi:serine/threonine protein phosphatase PrpC